jgi:OOP family OmpA-OmpF porin
MRFRGAAVTTIVAACVGLFPSRRAHAADCAGAVSPCIDVDTLWPHAGVADFVAVGSTETVTPGQVGFGLVATYQSRPLVLQVASPGAGAGGSEQDAVNDQVNGTFLWAFGVARRLELDLAIPLTFAQSGTGLSPVSGGPGLKDTAVRDVRFGFAYAILPRARQGAAGDETAGERLACGLLGRFEMSAPVGDSDQFAGEHSAVVAPSLAADCRIGRALAGVEVGARVRPITELLNTRIGTQIYAALGVGWDLLPRRLLGATLEAWVLPTLAAQDDLSIVRGAYTGTPNGQHIAPAEWQLSVRSSPLRGGDLSLQAGGGTGIPLSGELPATTPRFRFTLGVRWAVH